VCTLVAIPAASTTLTNDGATTGTTTAAITAALAASAGVRE
jgi:hypothetical protein